jgi:hypothetical protein
VDNRGVKGNSSTHDALKNRARLRRRVYPRDEKIASAGDLGHAIAIDECGTPKIVAAAVCARGRRDRHDALHAGRHRGGRLRPDSGSRVFQKESRGRLKSVPHRRRRSTWRAKRCTARGFEHLRVSLPVLKVLLIDRGHGYRSASWRQISFTATRRSDSRYATGLSSTPSTIENMAAAAPMVSASVTITVAAYALAPQPANRIPQVEKDGAHGLDG